MPDRVTTLAETHGWFAYWPCGCSYLGPDQPDNQPCPRHNTPMFLAEPADYPAFAVTGWMTARDNDQALATQDMTARGIAVNEL